MHPALIYMRQCHWSQGLLRITFFSTTPYWPQALMSVERHLITALGTVDVSSFSYRKSVLYWRSGCSYNDSAAPTIIPHTTAPPHTHSYYTLCVNLVTSILSFRLRAQRADHIYLCATEILSVGQWMVAVDNMSHCRRLNQNKVHNNHCHS